MAWKDAAEERGEGGWRGTRAIGGAGGVGGGHSSKKQEGEGVAGGVFLM